jgi:hypothetical protein
MKNAKKTFTSTQKNKQFQSKIYFNNELIKKTLAKGSGNNNVSNNLYLPHLKNKEKWY